MTITIHWDIASLSVKPLCSAMSHDQSEMIRWASQLCEQKINTKRVINSEDSWTQGEFNLTAALTGNLLLFSCAQTYLIHRITIHMYKKKIKCRRITHNSAL